jgi:hypothetical protein
MWESGEMSRSAYARRQCFLCGKSVSTNGLADTAHKRKHVREGRLVELERFDWRGMPMYGLVFVLPAEVDRMVSRGYYRRVVR